MRELIKALVQLKQVMSRNGARVLVYPQYFVEIVRAPIIFLVRLTRAQKIVMNDTFSFGDGFQNMSGKGISTVYVEGLNSPNRGWFRLSFASDLRCCYEIRS